MDVWETSIFLLDGGLSVEADNLRLGETAEVDSGLRFCVLGTGTESVLMVDVDKHIIPFAHVVSGHLGHFHASFER